MNRRIEMEEKCEHTRSNEAIRNNTTVFLPIESDQCQINGEYHKEYGQQNGLQFSKMDRAEQRVGRHRFTDTANRMHKFAENVHEIRGHNVQIDGCEIGANCGEIK